MPKRKHEQTFKEEYEVLWPVFKKSKKSASHAYCSVCTVDINIAHGGKDDCRRHVECQRHVKKAKLLAGNKNLSSLFIKSTNLSVIRAEALFTNFLLEHNVSLAASDHASSLFKKMFPDSEIASKYSCARTKTAAVIKCFAESSKTKVCEILKNNKFTLATDGSNNYNEKIFPIVVTYLDYSLGKQITTLLSLSKLASDGTGENIFNLIDSEFQKMSLTWENCIAFCSDNASVMTGKFKGVTKFIKERNSNILSHGCTCHLIHLAAQHSAKKLNTPLEDFFVDVFYYLKKSSKRLETFKECQVLCGSEIHKIVKYACTRWLSMDKVINRFLEQWEPLTVFFTEKEKNESDALVRIKKMISPVTKLYLLFLQNVLPLFTKINIIMQQEAPYVHRLQRELVSLYSECLSRFVKPSAVVCADDIFSIDVSDRSVQKSNEDLVIGSKTRQFLKCVPSDEVKKFFRHIRAYFEKACCYMLKKLPLQDDLLKHAEVADIHRRTKTKISSLQYFVDKFSFVLSDDEKSAVEIEFANFQIDKLNEEILNCERMDAAWYKVGCITDHNHSIAYKILPKIMQNVLLLPHSNAGCERIFSIIRKNRTEFRSNMNIETLESIIIEKCKLSSLNASCHHRNFTEEELINAKKATYLSSNKS